ncbi:hypothetical protein, partial [Moorena producens]|uniref:hypothetical protein n=1 Tax=Moorena producens TaxID=1155739 RepID=UPI0005C93AD1
EEELVRVRMRRTPLTEWTEYCRDGVEAIHVPGNHLTMINPPHAANLADAIASACDTGTAPQRS